MCPNFFGFLWQQSCPQSGSCFAVVGQGILQLFVGRWNENQEQCSSVKIVSSKLMEEETILKISEQIKTDNGIGRIGLTDKRLQL